MDIALCVPAVTCTKHTVKFLVLHLHWELCFKKQGGKTHSICPMSPLLKMNSKIDLHETQVGQHNMIKLNFHIILSWIILFSNRAKTGLFSIQKCSVTEIPQSSTCPWNIQGNLCIKEHFISNLYKVVIKQTNAADPMVNCFWDHFWVKMLPISSTNTQLQFTRSL